MYIRNFQLLLSVCGVPYRLLASLTSRYVTLVNKWVNYIAGKGENSHFQNSSPSCSGSTYTSKLKILQIIMWNIGMA